MLSQRIQHALEREVVGQRRVVLTLTRALTLAGSPLAAPERPLGVFLLVGPTGTGKSHAAHAAARLMSGGRDDAPVVADCLEAADWSGLLAAIAPAFDSGGASTGSVVLIEHLEAADPSLVRALLAALNRSRLVLPDGSVGRLEGRLILLTTSLCSREIYAMDRKEIGFAGGSADEETGEKARIYQLCCAAAEKRWGPDVLAHVDDLVVFHRLGHDELAAILDRKIDAMRATLGERGVELAVDVACRRFLVERSQRYQQHGAWFLVKVFRRYVGFPIADMLASGRLVRDTRVTVELHDEARVRFSVDRSERCTTPVRVPIAVADQTVGKTSAKRG